MGEPSPKVNAPPVLSLEAVEVVQASTAVMLGETSQNWAKWMDDKFEDPMVAFEGLKVLSCKLQLEVKEHKRELQQYNLKPQHNEKALQDLMELRQKNGDLESKIAELHKDVQNETFASSFGQGNVQSI